MNKLISLMAVFVIAFFAGNSFAFTPPSSPAPTSWISDTGGFLSPPAHRRLDAQLKVINQSSANEVAALIVPTLGGEDISDVANATFKSWGVGKRGLDNGVLVVLAMKEHKSRIETGKGVEGDLPDLKTQDILNKVLRPHMKSGDVEGALDSTFTAISSSIENHRADVASAAKANPPPPVVVTPVNPASPLPTTTSPSCDVGAVGSGTSVLGLLVLIFFGAMLFFNRVAKKQEKARQEAELLARQQRERDRQLRLAEQGRMAEERRQALAKLESDRQKLVAEGQALRAKAERERIALQQKATAAVIPVVMPVPAVHLKPVVHHEPPHPITRSVVHSEAPHKQESIASVASAAAVITAAAVAERESILARQRQSEREAENRREAQREAERESSRRDREAAQRREDEAERSRARQREADAAADRARRQREQDDEDRRRRDAESSSSSSSSYDYGSSSSGSDSGSSGGFGGGDSGGGGSSSDW